jgi:hypothetical protein
MSNAGNRGVDDRCCSSAWRSTVVQVVFSPPSNALKTRQAS